LKFCPNIHTLYAEVPFLDRFALAARSGFSAVEFWWPSGEDLDALTTAAHGARIEVALFTFDLGDYDAGDRGLAGLPDRQAEFLANVPVALKLATRLGCPRITAPVGLECAGLARRAQLEVAVESIRRAADQARPLGIDVLIEAVNTIDNGPYLLPRTDDAVAFIEQVARPNVKLQHDIYHMQRMEGNLAETLRRHITAIAHIQVADAPHRQEPGTGEINYPFLFNTLLKLGYEGFVGLEYYPSTSTEQSLSWLPSTWRQGTSADDIAVAS
jgi:hydroxypyruvate isomerase